MDIFNKEIVIFGRKITNLPLRVFCTLFEVFAALLFSALIALALPSLLFLFVSDIAATETWGLIFQSALLRMIFGVWIAFTPLLVVGLPIATLFVVKNWTGLPHILFAALIASICGVAMTGITYHFLIYGTITGFLFWLIECRPLRKKQKIRNE